MPVAIEIQNMSLVENAETIVPHFILELDGLMGQASLNG